MKRLASCFGFGPVGCSGCRCLAVVRHAGAVDLANYAPADAVVYVEFDNLADVARAIQHTDIWKAAAPITGNKAAS